MKGIHRHFFRWGEISREMFTARVADTVTSSSTESNHEQVDAGVASLDMRLRATAIAKGYLYKCSNFSQNIK